MPKCSGLTLLPIYVPFCNPKNTPDTYLTAQVHTCRSSNRPTACTPLNSSFVLQWCNTKSVLLQDLRLLPALHQTWTTKSWLPPQQTRHACAPSSGPLDIASTLPPTVSATSNIGPWKDLFLPLFLVRGGFNTVALFWQYLFLSRWYLHSPKSFRGKC